MRNLKSEIKVFDARRNFAVFGTAHEAERFAAEYFIKAAEESIQDHGFFTVALSGGSTPKAVYRELSGDPFREAIDWSRVLIFFSDERAVSPEDHESNYRMAMEAGFSFLPLKEDQIFRMKAEGSIDVEARAYETLLSEKLYQGKFDLVMLGIGEDAHTASLFPKTHALHSKDRKVVSNFVPKLNAWRISLTFTCINEARHILVLALGESKASAVGAVFNTPLDIDLYPSQGVGSPENKALWVLDSLSAKRVKPQN